MNAARVPGALHQRPRRSTRGPMLRVLAALIVLGVSACSSGDAGSGASTTIGSDGKRTGQTSGSYAELLATVPASFLDTGGPAGDAPLALSLGDTERAEQAAVALGLEIESARTTEAVVGLSRDVGLIVPALAMRSPSELPDAAGFGIADIDRFIELTRAADSFMSASGAFDPVAIGTTLAESPFWGPTTEQRNSGTMTSWVWGDDSLAIDMEGIDALRPVGRAVQIAADEKRLLAGARIAILDDALAIGGGRVPTLADDERFASIAAALDDAKALSAYISVTPWTFAELNLPSGSGQIVPSAEPHLSAFDAFAMGAALSGSEQAVVVVLHHQTAEQAAANADRLREVLAEGNEVVNGQSQPWSEVFSRTAVSVEGAVVTATLVPAEPNPHLWTRMWSTRTSLLAVG